MGSVIWFLGLVYYATFTCTASSDKLLTLDCQPETHGVYGQDTLLKCLVRSSEKDLEIHLVTWRRPGQKALLTFKSGKVTKVEDPRFALPQHGSYTDVSFLVKNTKKTDEGEYECQVLTDSGEDTAVVSLKVTAAYAKPAMSSIPEKDIEEEMDIILFCNASGGYPVGMIHWSDQHDLDWTRSAELTWVETVDKRFNLSSKFVLRASYATTKYKCRVLNSTGVQEGEEELELPFHEKPPARLETAGDTTVFVAVFVVVGSLACGLLVLALVRRRRCQPYQQPRDIATEECA